MKYYQETTQWRTTVQNHIYYLSDDKRKMVGYIRQGSSELFKFSKPMNFDSKGRKLTVLPLKGEPDSVYFPKNTDTSSMSTSVEVEGSNGKKYYLSKVANRWTCTCPGFQFRNKCKHTDGVK